MTRLTRIGLSVAVLGLAVMPVLSQTSGILKPSFEIEIRPSFQVASIRPNTDPASGFTLRREPADRTRLTITNATVKMLLSYAYGVRDFQIVDGPDWINGDRYDIEAKAADGTDEMALCTQSLLEDRFQLKLHRDSRDLPVYELVVAPRGARMTLSPDPSLPQQRGRVRRTPAGYTLRANRISLWNFIDAISDQLGHFILNKTDLKSGPYVVNLQWADNGAADFAAADAQASLISTVLEERLGLRLVPTKSPVEVLVIDSVQKPTVN